jgi:hypothetical protein
MNLNKNKEKYCLTHLYCLIVFNVNAGDYGEMDPITLVLYTETMF